jgi:spore coat protein U-like protein
LTRNIILTMIVSTFILVMATAWPSSGMAQTCIFSNSGLQFGTINISNGARVRTSGTFTATCTGTPGSRIRVCLNIGSGTGNLNPSGDPRYMTQGANRLNYNIFKRSNYTGVWGSFVWPYPPTPKTTNVRLNSSGNGSRSVPIRSEIYASQSGTPPGSYSSSFAGGHTLISYAYTSSGNCNTISQFGGVQVPFNVHANIVSACTVQASNLNFGSAGVLNSNVDANNTISVNCSNGTPYTIGLDGGLSGASNPTMRKMTSGISTINYGNYQNSTRSVPWGNATGTDTISNVGNGTTQNYTAHGRVQIQSTPPPGTYTDTIIVTMTY